MPSFSFVGVRLIGKPKGVSAPLLPCAPRSAPPADAQPCGGFPQWDDVGKEAVPACRPLSPRHGEQRRPPSGRGSGNDVDRGHRIPPLPSYRGGPKGVAADGSNLKQPRWARCWQPPACGSILYSLLWTPSLLGSEPSSFWPHTRLGAHGGTGPAAGEAAPGGAARLPLLKE